MTAQTIYPFLRYEDARAALSWLERAFGATPGLVVDGAGDTVAHAQVDVAGGIVMLGSAADDSLGMVSPRAAGGVTQGIYVAIDDADGHHARAAAAGAEIVRPPADTDYGSREYLARDLEGNLWSFGTYRPEPGE